jgi:hypothetical protein
MPTILEQDLLFHGGVKIQIKMITTEKKIIKNIEVMPKFNFSLLFLSLLLQEQIFSFLSLEKLPKNSRIFSSNSGPFFIGKFHKNSKRYPLK